MTRPLPPRPNLLQLKHQAKDLRKAQAAGEADALAQIRQYLPRCAEATDQEILTEKISLQEAQHVVACEYGFKHWEMLCAVVEADLDLLANLRDEEIKECLREIDYKDVVRAFKASGAVVRERFLSNMSLRVRTFIAEGMDFIENLSAEEAKEVRQKILHKVAELAVQDKIAWPA